MCCEGAPHGIKCDRSEKMVEVNGVCKLKQRELDSIPAESEDDEGDYEMERNVSVTVPQDPTIHGGEPSKKVEHRETFAAPSEVIYITERAGPFCGPWVC